MIPGEHPTVGVVGLGYVGLPLAVALAKQGCRVIGVDSNAKLVENIRRGDDDLSGVASSRIRELQSHGFTATMEFADLHQASVIIVCVPTPLNIRRLPNLDPLRAAVKNVSAHMAEGTLVVIESTSFPGTTEELVLPILTKGKRRVGRDFFLAFSPERIDPGNKTFSIENTPRIVGGVTSECALRAEALYSRLTDRVVRVRSPREAEMSKLLENTYRHVNIALVNEFAIVCHELGIDVWEVIEAAGTKPYGFEKFFPGPGVGGHCIPIDPIYLSEKVRSVMGKPFEFVELASRVNSSMPEYIGKRILDILTDEGRRPDHSSVLLLGASYKKDVADIRESPFFDVVRSLSQHGIKLYFHDPFFTEIPGLEGLAYAENPYESASKVALTVLLQAHSFYDLELIAEKSEALFDTRGVLSGVGYSL